MIIFWLNFTSIGIELKFPKLTILVGYQEKRNDVSNHIITVTKQNIFRSNISDSLPNIQHIKQEITNSYYIDRNISFSQCKYTVHKILASQSPSVRLYPRTYITQQRSWQKKLCLLLLLRMLCNLYVFKIHVNYVL